VNPIVVDNWRDFSRIMIETKDLDPTYPVLRALFDLHDSEWNGRFILHYMWFYNLRDAYNVAGSTTERTFWDKCRVDGAADLVKRRGARRHFRGAVASKAIELMSGKGLTPAQIVADMHKEHYPAMVKHIRNRYEGCQLGPYYIWKLMDWYDICLDWPVTMSIEDAIKYMPDVPKQAAADFFPYNDLRDTIRIVLDHVSQFDHPVKVGEKCGLGEVETVICTLKGYLKTKAHWIGEDIADAWNLLGDLPQNITEHIPARIPQGLYVRGEYRHVA
jgi:hypothetical protein